MKIAFFLVSFATLYHLWILSPFWYLESPTKTPADIKNQIDVFYANLNSQNQEKQLLIDYLKKESPDLVLLVEVNKTWANEIKKLKDQYPYSQAIVHDGNFGMAVLSKEKVTLEKTLVDKENFIPALFLSVENSGSTFKTILLHSFPPFGHYGTLIRDRYLQTVSRTLTGEKSPMLVCGDFNTTPWTAIFQDFLKHSGLHLSSLIRTWPTWPFSGLSIDHCLSKNIGINQYRKGPYIGSDHWPLLLQVSNNQ